MTGRREDHDPGLDPFFDAARQTAPQPEADFLARVLADAEAAQIRTTALPAHRWRARLAELGRALGGWPAMAGLSTAAVAGLWIGIAPPAMLLAQVDGWLGAAGPLVIDAEPVTMVLLTEEAM
ncbi:hypothetical protein [Roseovarius aestuariivivens]|uniref:hypothetical protein n=1 Tax=Roseovarius aestuariivivens TaxID=1888910 RepID=UPI0010815D07|nr:hypothetical protein [Roseovarius aestuariivivens]